MNAKLFGFAGVITFALFGCGDSGTDSGDTGYGGTTGSVAVELDAIDYPSCSGNTWTYAAETLGWTDSNNLVNAWETGVADGGGWNDEHTLLSASYEPDGSRDYLEISLTSGIDMGAWVDGESTVFSCGVHDVENKMTFAYRVYDLDGNYADCGVLSSDTIGGGVADVYSGVAPDWTPVTAPTEISAANCLEWDVSR